MGSTQWSKPASSTDEENEILEEQKVAAKRLLKRPRGYWVDSIRYPAPAKFAQEARPGHTVVENNRDGRSIDVWPPARVVYRRSYTSAGRKRVGIHLERSNSDVAYLWRPFQNAVKAAGVRVEKSTEREVRNRDHHEPLLRYFRLKLR